jgi:hypothetical protein
MPFRTPCCYPTNHGICGQPSEFGVCTDISDFILGPRVLFFPNFRPIEFGCNLAVGYRSGTPDCCRSRAPLTK